MSVSEVQEFFKNQTVFITGSTGLLGKLVFRKLLATCDVKKIFLLLREKKGRSVEERVERLLESICFGNLESEKSRFIEKVFIMKGDCGLPGFGLSQDDRNLLVQETTCVIHSAATVRFDEHLRTAAYVNIRAVQDLVGLAKEMVNLRVVVYVSTAYSNSNQKYFISEKFYKPPMKAQELMQLIKTLDDETLKSVTSELLNSWPNTYTFTKAIAENVIKDEGQNMPIAIVRPGVLMGTCQEPEPGWIDVIQGNTAFFIGTLLGIIHCQMVHDNVVAMVPLDYAVNNILSSAWYTSTKSTNPTIYNLVGSGNNVITSANLRAFGKSLSRLYASVYAVSPYFLITTKKKYVLKFYQFWLHLVPAYAVDLIMLCLGKQRKFAKMYQKFHAVCEAVEFFTLNWWIFETTNTDILWKALNEKDRQLFPFNTELLDWERYVENCAIYGRVHLVHDPLETVPQGKRRQMLLKLLFGCIFLLLGCLLCYLLYCLFY
ncbi:hypothetical protein Zmor_028109 [Zophobas morio]|uniref:Fatty acyl-CoA reductase n=1 Tax=Zophobas morio TaxID=2755281 RepID=A0AA38HUW4_9CUCU|nr:hypothetical protein Zmor_028109 [Zophobas morio]